MNPELPKDDDRLYPIRPSLARFLHCGMREGEQILITPRTPAFRVVHFDLRGELTHISPFDLDTALAPVDAVSAWFERRGVQRCPIAVRRFWLADSNVGIQQLPDSMRE